MKADQMPRFIWLGHSCEDAMSCLSQFEIATQATWVIATIESEISVKQKGTIRGIFLALDVNDFISATPESLQKLAMLYQHRLNGLKKQVKVPVFSLWLHTETIPGMDLRSLKMDHSPKEKLECLQSQVEWKQCEENWVYFSKHIPDLKMAFRPEPHSYERIMAHCPPPKPHREWLKLTMVFVLVLYLFSSMIESYWVHKKWVKKVLKDTDRSLIHFDDVLQSEHHKKWRLEWGFHRFQNLKSLTAKSTADSFRTDIITPLMKKMIRDLNSENSGEQYLIYKMLMTLTHPAQAIEPDVAHFMTDYWLADSNNKLKDSLPREHWYPVFQMLLPTLNRSEWSSLEIPKLTITSRSICQTLYESWVLEDSMHHRDVSLEQLLKGSNPLFISDATLPKRYTRSVADDFIQVKLPRMIQQAKLDRWIMDESQNILDERCPRELKALYRKDYSAHWVEFIHNIKIRPSHSLKGAINQLNQLHKHPSNIRGLAELFQKNLSNIHARDYQWYLSSLTALSQDLKQTEPEWAFQYAKDMLHHNPKHSMIRTEMKIQEWVDTNIHNDSLRNAMKHWLISPLDDLGHQILKTASEHLEWQWSHEIVEYYHQNIASYYPVSPNGPDMPWDRYIEFYHPESGKLAQFYRDYVQPSQGSWHDERFRIPAWNPIFHSPLNFEVLIKPVAQVKEVTLSVNHQIQRYQNQPEEWVDLIWKPESGQNEVSFRVLDNHNQELLKIDAKNTWALWHWLSTADAIEYQDPIIWMKWNLSKKLGRKELVIGLTTKQYPHNIIGAILNKGLEIPDQIIQSTAP